MNSYICNPGIDKLYKKLHAKKGTGFTVCIAITIYHTRKEVKLGISTYKESIHTHTYMYISRA